MNTAAWGIWKLILRVLITRGKNPSLLLLYLYLYEMMGVNESYYSSHFTLYVSQVIMLYTFNLHSVKYISINWKKKTLDSELLKLEQEQHRWIVCTPKSYPSNGLWLPETPWFSTRKRRRWCQLPILESLLNKEWLILLWGWSPIWSPSPLVNTDMAIGGPHRQYQTNTKGEKSSSIYYEQTECLIQHKQQQLRLPGRVHPY